MNILKLTPVVLSFLLLGTHFLRADYSPLVAVCVLFPLLLFVKKPWVARLTQAFLVLGTAEWVRVLWILTERRQAFGQPWIRSAIILGAVALFTGLSVLIFQTASMKKRYKTGGDSLETGESGISGTREN